MYTLSDEPSFLVASPQLVDPNFKRAVVLLLESDDEGAMGLVINKISDNNISDLLTENEGSVHPLAKVWLGGPCLTEQGLLLHSEKDQDRVSEYGDIFISSSKKVLRSLSEQEISDANQKLYLFRFIVGYAGWGAEQLADEIRQGAWLQMPVDHNILFNTPCEDIWSKLMQNLGVRAESLIAVPQGLPN